MQLLGIETLFKGKNSLRLLEGLWVSLRISLIAVLISLALGLLLGALVAGKKGIPSKLYRVYLETVRIMPQMVLLFIVFFGTTRVLGINVDAELAAIIVFSFWGTAEMSDIVRGAILSIPKAQREGAAALGMNDGQILFHITIPQAVRRLIPLSINLITRMIKTTSLVMMIGVVEVSKVGQQIIEANRMSSPNGAFGIYLIIFLLYFIICWPVSLASKKLEARWNEAA